MPYINARLPLQMELNAVRREVEKGLVLNRADNGKVFTNQRHAQATFEYEVGYPPQGYEASVITEVKTLYRVSRGGELPFRFRDFDPSMSRWDMEAIYTCDGTDTLFQCRKYWTVGGQSAEHLITKPVSPISVYLNGVLQTSGVTVNYDTGVITFTSAPANGDVLSLDGYFDILVRFDDAYEAEGLTHLLEQGGSLKLIEDPDL